MTKRTVVLDIGSGPDLQATTGYMYVQRYYPGPDGDTFIHASAQKVLLTDPPAEVDLTVGEFYTYTPATPLGVRMTALTPAGSGPILYSELTPVDEDSLEPLPDLDAVWAVLGADLAALGERVDNLALGEADDPSVAFQVSSGALTGAAVDARIEDGITGKADLSQLNAEEQAREDGDAAVTAAVTTALETKADLVGGTVPANQLPSFVDDVLEFTSLAAFPATGVAGKIYVAIDTNLTYRWGGSAYGVLDPSLALGENSTTAYRGDRGKTAFDHSQTTGNPHGLTRADIGAQAAATLDADAAALVPGATALGAALAAKIPTINVKDAAYGAIGDGTTDDTAHLQAALNAVDATKGRTTVSIPAGTYMVNGVNLAQPDGASRGIGGGIQPKAGTTIVLAVGATIKVISNNSQGYAAIYVGPDVDNVSILGPGSIVGDRDTHDYTTAGTHEWGYGVYARGAQNVTVDGVNISKMTGDCVLGSSVGGVDDADPAYNPSSGRIVNCYLDGARRNNISLIGCDHFLVENNTISRAGYNDGIHDGTAPRAGIDLEFSSTQAVKNTDIRNNRFVGNVTSSVEAFNSSGLHVESNFMDTQIIVGAHVLNNCTIRGNYVINLADTTTVGITLSPGSVGGNNVLVADNIVMGFNTGIGLTGFGATCSGNYLSGFTFAGINTQLATDISIIGNHIADPAVAAATPAGIVFSTPAASPRIEVLDNRISGCYYGMNWRQSATGVTAKGNIISKAFIGFNVGTGCAAIIENNVTDLPGHTAGQSSDVVTQSTSKTSVIGNTFRNSTAPSVAAISGGSGGISRIIDNKIINTTAASGITAVGGAHEITGNILSSAATSGTNYAIQITGAASGCLVVGNAAYHTGTTAWSRLVKSDAATGTPATQIIGNSFFGGTVATAHASDYVAGNTFQGVKRVVTAASGATLDVNVDQVDAAKRTAQAVNLTINAPTGTPGSMQEILYRITDNGTARTITWNAVFTGELPTTTVVGVNHYVLARWNSDAAKYECKNLTAITGTRDGTKFLRDDGTWATPSGGSSSAATPQPADQNLIGWAFDPTTVAAGTALSGGAMITVRVPIRAAGNITNLLIGISGAGSGLTSGQCFAALYQGGNLLGVTADQSASWNSTGLKTMALAGGATAVVAGYIEVAFWAVGTTPPSVWRGGSATSTVVVNAGIGAGDGRFCSANSGLTTTAPSTVGVRSAALPFWAAVS